jgi:hypothetical protein
MRTIDRLAVWDMAYVRAEVFLEAVAAVEGLSAAFIGQAYVSQAENALGR